jgi:hypothetical protein
MQRHVEHAGSPVSGAGSSTPLRMARTWPLARTLTRKSPFGSGSRLHGRSMPWATTLTRTFCRNHSYTRGSVGSGNRGASGAGGRGCANTSSEQVATPATTSTSERAAVVMDTGSF